VTTQPVADHAVNLTGTITSGRVPPNDLGAERAVLGSLMIDQAAVAEIRDVLDPEDFYAERHAHIYRAAVALADRGDPIDEVTLQSQLERGPGIGRAGGLDYISELTL
jgi:replicative DNA helicase